MTLANELPKVQRRDGKNPVAMWILLGMIVLLVVVIGVLLTSGPLFDQGPQSDLERDYQLLLDALKTNPKDPAILMTLAEVEYELGKKADAFEHAEKAMANAKGRSGFALRYAQLLVREERLEDAKKQLLAEIKLSGKNSAEPYFLMAQIERDQKKYDKAIEHMQQGLKLAPQAADMVIVYGEILEKAGKKKQAIEAFKTALRYLPNDEAAIAGLKRLGSEVPTSTGMAPVGPSFNPTTAPPAVPGAGK